MNCALARVKLMLKKEFETDPFVYKTILLLQVISKNLKTLYHQRVLFLVLNDILYEFQTGVGSTHSTHICIYIFLDGKFVLLVNMGYELVRY